MHSFQQALAEPARYPHLTHPKLSSSDELLLSSSTVSIKKTVRIINIALTVKDTNTGTREMKTLKSSANVAYCLFKIRNILI